MPAPLSSNGGLTRTASFGGRLIPASDGQSPLRLAFAFEVDRDPGADRGFELLVALARAGEADRQAEMRDRVPARRPRRRRSRRPRRQSTTAMARKDLLLRHNAMRHRPASRPGSGRSAARPSRCRRRTGACRPPRRRASSAVRPPISSRPLGSASKPGGIGPMRLHASSFFSAARSSLPFGRSGSASRQTIRLRLHVGGKLRCEIGAQPLLGPLALRDRDQHHRLAQPLVLARRTPAPRSPRRWPAPLPRSRSG